MADAGGGAVDGVDSTARAELELSLAELTGVTTTCCCCCCEAEGVEAEDETGAVDEAEEAEEVCLLESAEEESADFISSSILSKLRSSRLLKSIE